VEVELARAVLGQVPVLAATVRALYWLIILAHMDLGTHWQAAAVAMQVLVAGRAVAAVAVVLPL
jgi:hypothetical protein